MEVFGKYAGQYRNWIAMDMSSYQVNRDLRK